MFAAQQSLIFRRAPFVADRMVPRPDYVFSAIRRVTRSYAGSLLQVTPDGSATRDIGGVALDTASIAAYLNGSPGYVSRLYEQMGSGAYFASNAFGHTPLFDLYGCGGLPTLSFDGVDDIMLEASVIAAALAGNKVPYTMMALCQLGNYGSAVGVKTVLALSSSTSVNPLDRINVVNGTSWGMSRRDDTGGGSAGTNAGTPDSLPHILTKRMNGATVDFWVDTIPTHTAVAYSKNQCTFKELVLGNLSAVGTNAIPMFFSELWIWKQALQ